MTKRTPDRVFLDANVLFSAAYREGAGLRALWRKRTCVLLTSGFAREEVSRNLESAQQRERLRELMENVEVVPEAVVDSRSERWGLPDKDAPVLTAAVRAEATHLITGDLRHFGHLMDTTVEGVLILRPATYLARK